MLGAILIVSGPTVVTPILAAARPGRKLTTILGYEGTTIDPIGAIIAVIMFNELQSTHYPPPCWHGLLHLHDPVRDRRRGRRRRRRRAVAAAEEAEARGILATQAIIATVITIAGLCDALAG